MRDELRNVEAHVVAALARGEHVDSCALLFLLRRYRSTARDDLGEMLGPALAVALDSYERDASVEDGAAWLALFVEAGALSDDDRLRDAIGSLAARLRESWSSPRLDESALAIDACLRAAYVAAFAPLAAEAIDQLERVVGGAYRPGHGVGGDGADQVRAASTLLTAYGLSGRLPYSMLAEELMQHVQKGAAHLDFVIECERARVLCRLARLHDDPDYRAAAVVAPDADYRRDAERLLAAQSAEAQRRGAAGAIYGLALLELESAELP